MNRVEGTYELVAWTEDCANMYSMYRATLVWCGIAL